MVVNSYEEASSIVQTEVAKGKKIGQWVVSGPFHEGYKLMATEIRKYCDYVICQCPLSVMGVNDTYYKILPALNIDSLLVSKTFSERFLPESILGDIDLYYDLVIRSMRPIPPPDKIRKVVEYTEQFFINVYKTYFPEEKGLGHHVCTGMFASLYYVNTFMFPISVKVASYKEGVWRFVQKRLFKEYLSCDVYLFEPVRDEYGMVISSTALESTSRMEQLQPLKEFLHGSKLITSKDESFIGLQERLNPIGWKVYRFEKYSGELLNYQSEYDTYIFASIGPPSMPLYDDGFLL